MDKTLLRSTDGYTFIELLVAITILGFVVAPFLGLFTGSFSAIAQSGRQSSAINLCREKMESVKAIGYAAAYECYRGNEGSPYSEEQLPSHPGFRRVTEIKPVLFSASGTYQPNPDLLQITITVYWIVHDQEYSETLESYLARR